MGARPDKDRGWEDSPEKEKEMKWRPPLQSKQYCIGKGWLHFAILKLPCFALTIELSGNGKKWGLALCLIIFAVVYEWDNMEVK